MTLADELEAQRPLGISESVLISAGLQQRILAALRAQEERKGERRKDKMWTWDQPRRRSSINRRKVAGTKAHRGAKHGTTENAGESSTVHAEVASAAPLPDRIDALLSGVPSPDLDRKFDIAAVLNWQIDAIALLREAAKELLFLRACDKWVPCPVALGFMPERNAHVLYWHKSGYFAFADEWRDDQHGQIATHWWRLPPIPEKP